MYYFIFLSFILFFSGCAVLEDHYPNWMLNVDRPPTNTSTVDSPHDDTPFYIKKAEPEPDVLEPRIVDGIDINKLGVKPTRSTRKPKAQSTPTQLQKPSQPHAPVAQPVSVPQPTQPPIQRDTQYDYVPIF